MATEPRKVLTQEEKNEIMENNKNCYICLQTLNGYSKEEIEFDHIYNYEDGHPQELSNFAPVHASKDIRRLNCHKAKGKKSPFEYREEIRIKTKLDRITGLKDLCNNPIKSVYNISDDKKTININGEILPLYNQRIKGTDNYYFFCEADIKYLENDDKIQLRPLEPKILSLIFNLKQAVQLLPSLGRLDQDSKTIKIFDGQHKAVAQIIGNNRDKIMCLVFVNPDVDKLRIVIYQAHTDFVQQRYKKSHIDAKLADIYKQKIISYREKVGNPNANYSEKDILNGESKASISNFLLSSILQEIQQERSFIRDYAAQSRSEQKKHPVLWQSLERIIKIFCNLGPVDETSDSEKNYRSDEIDNICFILDQIEEFSIKNKWDPENPDSESHLLSRTYFYRTAFNNWIDTLQEALKFALELMYDKKIYNAICYQVKFSPEVRSRFSNIIKKLFEHPLWVKREIQNEIATTNQEPAVKEIFKREGLDYIYLTKL
jgi:hypothetical protein